MDGLEAFADLRQSADSDARGHAAHLAALAYLDQDGSAEEHAALYAVLVGFLYQRRLYLTDVCPVAHSY